MAGEFTTDMGVLAGITELNNRFEWYYGDVEPVNPRPFLNWAHLSADLWKQRNAENTDWIIRGILSQPYFGLGFAEPLGIAKEYYGTILPYRYLWCDGKTIGDASSGATARANADTIDLYTVLWNAANVAGSQIQLFDSLGAATAKGASAAADFAAHKRLSLPDKRGRVGIGLDNMGDTSANVVTNANADILGGTGGEENHTLSINEIPSHNHGGATGTDSPDHTHSSWSNGSGSNMISVFSGNQPIGTLVSTNGASTRHTHSISVQGGGAAHNNMQPWVACNYIMRY